MTIPNLPPRGQDPQLDEVLSIVERCAMKDPDTLLRMLSALLRFLRANGTPGICISFEDLAAAGTPSEKTHGLTFGINLDNRELFILLLDSDSRAGILAQAAAEFSEFLKYLAAAGATISVPVAMLQNDLVWKERGET